MKMKIIPLLCTSVLLTQSSSCQQIAEKKYEIRAEAVDELGKPVADIQVITGRLEAIADSVVPMATPMTTEPVLTDEKGFAVIDFRSVPQPSGNITFYQDGYYTSSERVEWVKAQEDSGLYRVAKVSSLIKPMKNPIPMHASFFGNTRIMIPSLNVDYGYDLQRCNLTAPHGSGREKDVIFRVEGTNDGNGNGRMKLTIRTNAKKAGFFPFSTPDRDRGSDLISGYLAPEKQYASVMSLLFDSSDVEAKMNQPTDGNLYFRVRTKLKSDNSIESCHYGKIYGPFTFWGIPTSRGGVATFGMATCYFNPTPNDRNVEFDTKRNLNPDGNVWSP